MYIVHVSATISHGRGSLALVLLLLLIVFLLLASSCSQVVREVRFSLDGLVIPRATGLAVPSHLGLHHHGDDPAVSTNLLVRIYEFIHVYMYENTHVGSWIHTR